MVVALAAPIAAVNAHAQPRFEVAGQATPFRLSDFGSRFGLGLRF
jgi:hypothetical protein